VVISVQGDHLLSMLSEMNEHKNLATYTTGKANSSRVGAINFENCDEKAIAVIIGKTCIVVMSSNGSWRVYDFVCHGGYLARQKSGGRQKAGRVDAERECGIC
jgi:hypothetical protein